MPNNVSILSKVTEVAKLLGCGYRVLVGVGPVALFVSNDHPEYAINMPEALVERLSGLKYKRKVVYRKR